MRFATQGSEEAALLYHRLSDYQFREGKNLLRALHPKKGDKVLDVGCGTGRLTAEIAEVVSDEGFVLGIDPDATRIKLACESYARPGHLEFTAAFADEIPEEHAPFDGAFSNFVLHWLTKEQKKNALIRIAKLLRPEGIFVANVPAPHSDIEAWKALFPENLSSDFSTIQIVEPREWTHMLEAAGFAKITIKHEQIKEQFQTLEALYEWVEAVSHGVVSKEKIGQEAFEALKVQNPGPCSLAMEHFFLKAHRTLN